MATTYRLILADDTWARLLIMAKEKGMTMGKLINEILNAAVELGEEYGKGTERKTMASNKAE